MTNLSTTYLGIPLKNPILIASSGLTDSVEKNIELAENGAGGIVLKSLFEEEIILEMEEKQHEMTNRPYIFPETMDYMRQQSEPDTVRNYLKLITETKKAIDIPVIASINCITSQKWMYLAKEIEKAGADALELNIFLLPSDIDREPLENIVITEAVLEQVKNKVTIPVSVKISHYCSNLASYISRIDRAGCDGIVLFNRSWMPDIDIETLSITSGMVLSNSTDMSIPLRWISIMSGRINCDLAASTGVHDGTTLIKMLLAGASVVQIASTVYENGPEQIGKMLKKLQSWMMTNEFDYIEEFKGRLSQRKLPNPAAWERVQFMKHFREYVS